jgi:hypothetical protein
MELTDLHLVVALVPRIPMGSHTANVTVLPAETPRMGSKDTSEDKDFKEETPVQSICTLMNTSRLRVPRPEMNSHPYKSS